jgi:hypothetical protein
VPKVRPPTAQNLVVGQETVTRLVVALGGFPMLQADLPAVGWLEVPMNGVCPEPWPPAITHSDLEAQEMVGKLLSVARVSRVVRYHAFLPPVGLVECRTVCPRRSTAMHSEVVGHLMLTSQSLE